MRSLSRRNTVLATFGAILAVSLATAGPVSAKKAGGPVVLRTTSGKVVKQHEPVWLGDWEYTTPSIVFESSHGRVECEYGSEGDGLWTTMTQNESSPLILEINYGTGILGGNPSNYCTNTIPPDDGVIINVEKEKSPLALYLYSNGRAEIASDIEFSVSFVEAENCHFSAAKLRGSFPVSASGQYPDIHFTKQKLELIKAGSGGQCPKSAKLSLHFYGAEYYPNIKEISWTDIAN
jgi:hypothetical protein